MLLHQVLHDEPRPPRRLNDRIPRDLETICLKAMAKEPARRYATAGDLADDLRRFLARRADPGPAGRAASERLWRWCRRNPALATAAGLGRRGDSGRRRPDGRLRARIERQAARGERQRLSAELIVGRA